MDPLREPHRHRDRGHPGGGRHALGVVAGVLLAGPVDVGGRTQPGRVDERVDFGPVHRAHQVAQIPLARLVVEIVGTRRIPLGRMRVERRVRE